MKLKKWPENGTRVPEAEDKQNRNARAYWYNGRIVSFDNRTTYLEGGTWDHHKFLEKVAKQKAMAPYKPYTRAVFLGYLSVAMLIIGLFVSMYFMGIYGLPLLALILGSAGCGFLAGLPVSMPEKEVWKKDSKF